MSACRLLLVPAVAVALLAAGCGGSSQRYDVDEVRDAFVASRVDFGRLIDFRNGSVTINGAVLRAPEGVLASSEGGTVRIQIMESDSRAEETTEFWNVLADPGFITHQGNVAVQVSPPRAEQVDRVKAALLALDQ